MLYQMVINHSGYTIIHKSKVSTKKKTRWTQLDKDLKIIKSEGKKKKKNHILWTHGPLRLSWG